MKDKKLKGLGGWLILVGIGVVISPIRLLFEAIPMYVELFSNGSFENLTTPGTVVYHPLWIFVIYGEILANIFMFGLGLYLLYLYFGKKPLFPKVYIFGLCFSLAIIIVDTLIIGIIVPLEDVLDPVVVADFSRSLIAAAIWIPYMLVSQRVEQTFVALGRADQFVEDFS